MTDGIIQKIFNNKKSRYDWTEESLVFINMLEQELIEEIKKLQNEFPDCSYPDIIYLKLIGDSQE